MFSKCLQRSRSDFYHARYYTKLRSIIKGRSLRSYSCSIVTSVTLLGTVVSYWSYCDVEKKLSKSDFLLTLKNELHRARQKLLNEGKQTPTLAFRVDDDEYSSTQKPTHIVQFTITKDMDILGLLGHWSTITSSENTTHINFSSTTIQSGRPGFSLSLISPNDTASILIESTPLRQYSLSPHNQYQITLQKEEGFTEHDVTSIVKGYSAAVSTTSTTAPSLRIDDQISDIFRLFSDQDVAQSTLQSGRSSRGSDDPVSKLRAIGVEVYEKSANNGLTWESLAGYDRVKTVIEDTIINALKFPEVYDAVASRTRASFSANCNKPKAVLFEGPPGTGKTLTARILAERVDKPMVQLSVEQIVSKWYGDSEKKLSQIFDLCEELGGAVLFMDEVDALATSRDSDAGMHEATRRILSVMLQRLEGFKGGSSNVLVCATNRKQDLDAALLSRFDLCIRYDLPDLATRQAVFARYAKHLSAKDLSELALSSQNVSCRDIRDVCSQTERTFASKIIRKEAKSGEVPSLSDYRKHLEDRIKESGLSNGTDI